MLSSKSTLNKLRLATIISIKNGDILINQLIIKRKMIYLQFASCCCFANNFERIRRRTTTTAHIKSLKILDSMLLDSFPFYYDGTVSLLLLCIKKDDADDDHDDEERKKRKK